MKGNYYLLLNIIKKLYTFISFRLFPFRAGTLYVLCICLSETIGLTGNTFSAGLYIQPLSLVTENLEP